MKIYRVDFHDADEGTVVSWHSAKADAETVLRAFQRERDEPVGVEQVTREDVPTTRHALIDWLNRNLTSDNG